MMNSVTPVNCAIAGLGSETGAEFRRATIDAPQCKPIRLQDKRASDQSLRVSSCGARIPNVLKDLNGAIVLWRRRAPMPRWTLRRRSGAAQQATPRNICPLRLRRLDIQILPGYTAAESLPAE